MKIPAFNFSFVEVSRLNTQETWELEYDEQLGSHTKLPNLFHDLVVTKANIIYENVLSVNVTKGERKVSRLIYFNRQNNLHCDCFCIVFRR